MRNVFVLAAVVMAGCSSSSSSSDDTGVADTIVEDTVVQDNGDADTGGSETASVTWTEVYANVFGPAAANCASCHANGQSGLTTGTTQASFYTGLVNDNLITPGSNSATSAIIGTSSPLMGVATTGNMPLGGTALTSTQIAMLTAWIDQGAQNN
jgi:hypothetical protein